MDSNLLDNLSFAENILFANKDGITFWESLPITGNGLLACLLSSFLCSFIGVDIIYRKIIFVSLAISQISSLGVAITLFITKNNTENQDNFSIFSIYGLNSLIASLIASFLFSLKTKEENFTKESIIGISYILPSAFVLLIMDFLSQDTNFINNIIFGNAVFIDLSSLELLFFTVFMIFILHILFFKEFNLVSFDYDSIKVSNIKFSFYEKLFYFSLAVTISITVSSIGILPILSFMILSPISAMLISKKINKIFLLSTIFGFFSSFIGFYISYVFSLPTGAAMISVSSIILIFNFLSSKFLSFFSKNH